MTFRLQWCFGQFITRLWFCLHFTWCIVVLVSYSWPLYSMTSIIKGLGGSMSPKIIVGLPNNTYKPITNMAWIPVLLCKLQKGCTRLTATSDKVYQLLAHGRWFSPGTPASSTTKTGRHDIAEILLKVVLNTKNQSINQIIKSFSGPISLAQIL